MGPTALAMDQRSQATSVAGRSALLERMLAILERQHGERAAGDQQRLNEQKAIAKMMRMLGDEEPTQGATSMIKSVSAIRRQHNRIRCSNYMCIRLC